MNFWNRIKYALSDHPPDGMTEEEWEQIKAEHHAEEKRRDEINRQVIANFKNTPEYLNAGFFKRLRMVFYYRVFLDKSGEMQIGGDDSDHTTEEIIAILNEETEALAKMPREERIAYFKRMDKFNNMNFTMDFGTTVLHVNTISITEISSNSISMKTQKWNVVLPKSMVLLLFTKRTEECILTLIYKSDSSE